jgi:hypothetical protein
MKPKLILCLALGLSGGRKSNVIYKIFDKLQVSE